MLFTIEKQVFMTGYFPIFNWEHSRNRSHMMFFFYFFFYIFAPLENAANYERTSGYDY
jgi:hypothetical protein